MSLLAFATAEEGLGDVIVSGSVAQNSIVKRTGTYSYKVNPTVTYATEFEHGITLFFTASSTTFFQVAISSAASGNLNNFDRFIICWRNGGTIIGGISFNDYSNMFKVWVGNKDTQIGSFGGSPPADGIFLLIEGRIVLSNTTGIVQIKFDGSIITDYSGDTMPGADTTINNIGCWAGDTYSSFYYDDFAVGNDQGDSFTSWLNGLKFHYLGVTGAGNYAQWTPSAGVNYQCVDENPPAISDYVSSSTTGQKDSYAIADAPAQLSGIQGIAIRYWGEGGGDIKRLARINNTDYLGGTITLPGSFSPIADVMANNPATGVGWTEADVNSLEVGMEKQ